MTAFLAELIGTMLLITLGSGVVAGVILKGTKAENAGWIVITLGWGLAVTFPVYAMGNFSGAHLNPAVTLAFAAVGEFPWNDVPKYILAQIIGAFLGAVVVWLHYLPHWKETRDPMTKLAVFGTGPAIRKPLSNVVSEMVGTFVLIFGLFTIGANTYAEGLNPLIVGLLIVAIGLSLGSTTGYAINPARDFGPRLAHFLLPIPGKGSSDWAYAWIPIIGPIIGGTLGGLVYRAIFNGEFHPLLWIMAPLALLIMVAAVIKDTYSRAGVPAQKQKN